MYNWLVATYADFFTWHTTGLSGDVPIRGLYNFMHYLRVHEYYTTQGEWFVAGLIILIVLGIVAVAHGAIIDYLREELNA